MSKSDSATSLAWMWPTSRTSSEIAGQSRCSQGLCGLSKLIQNSSTSGKLIDRTFSTREWQDSGDLTTYAFCFFRIYEHIFADVEEKDLNFQKIVEENFGHKKLVELITMVHEESMTKAHAKLVMKAIVDGDIRMPS